MSELGIIVERNRYQASSKAKSIPSKKLEKHKESKDKEKKEKKKDKEEKEG